MPQAHGDDRARALGDGRWLLISARSKGWDVRTLPIRGRPHPGTGVDWDGECFEVISSEAAEGGKVRYVLAAWAEEHAIRRMERYDEAAEAQHAAERRSGVALQRTRRMLVSLMFFTGQAPNPVQEQWERRYAFPGPLATLSSAVPYGVLGAVGTIFMIVSLFGIRVPGGPLVMLGPYLLVVSGIRVVSAATGRPMGTPAGMLVRLLWRSLRRAE